MGFWGVRSDEVDEAAEALDAGFERVHGVEYERLMDDRNPLSFEQVQGRLADGRTLAAALDAHAGAAGADPRGWDEVDRLAFAGIVVRHAELGVALPGPARDRALAFLEAEAIDWGEPTKRKLRRDQEIDLLRRAATVPGDG